MATVESMEQLDGRADRAVRVPLSVHAPHLTVERPTREYFARNIWVNADPREKLLPLIVQFVGDDKFFAGSDYPHAEGFAHLAPTMKSLLSALPNTSVEKILGANAAAFYGI